MVFLSEPPALPHLLACLRRVLDTHLDLALQGLCWTGVGDPTTLEEGQTWGSGRVSDMTLVRRTLSTYLSGAVPNKTSLPPPPQPLCATTSLCLPVYDLRRIA